MKQQSQSTTARRVKTSLVATLPKANPPVIWRFDLERNHSFTLALQGDNHDWDLGVTSAKGDFHPIAHFSLRADAEEAFARISKVLEGNRGYLALFVKSLLVLIGGIVGLYILAAFFTVLSSTNRQNTSPPTLSEDSQPMLPPPPPTPDGEPVSADDALKPPAP